MWLSMYMESETIPIVIVVPRVDSLKNTCSSLLDVNCLKNLLSNHHKVLTCGSKRTGLSHRYGTFGVHCNQFKPGLSHRKIHECCEDDYSHLKRMLARANHLAKMHQPFGLMSTIKEIKRVVRDNS